MRWSAANPSHVAAARPSYRETRPRRCVTTCVSVPRASQSSPHLRGTNWGALLAARPRVGPGRMACLVAPTVPACGQGRAVDGGVALVEAPDAPGAGGGVRCAAAGGHEQPIGAGHNSRGRGVRRGRPHGHARASRGAPRRDERVPRGHTGLGMGGGAQRGAGVRGAAVPGGPGGPCAGGGAIFRPPGAGSFQGVHLVSGTVASGVLGACVTRLRSAARPWGALRGNRGRRAGASAPDVCVVASGAGGHAATRDFSVRHDAASPRGGATLGSGQPVWGAQDRWDVSGPPAAARGVVDVRAGCRGGTDQEHGREVDPSRGTLAPGTLWHAERRGLTLCRKHADRGGNVAATAA